MDEGGSEFSQFYRFDLATGAYEMISDGKSVNRPGPFSNHGGRLAFSSTRRNAKDFDLYAMDPAPIAREYAAGIPSRRNVVGAGLVAR